MATAPKSTAGRHHHRSSRDHGQPPPEPTQAQIGPAHNRCSSSQSPPRQGTTAAATHLHSTNALQIWPPRARTRAPPPTPRRRRSRAFPPTLSGDRQRGAGKSGRRRRQAVAARVARLSPKAPTVSPKSSGRQSTPGHKMTTTPGSKISKCDSASVPSLAVWDP